MSKHKVSYIFFLSLALLLACTACKKKKAFKDEDGQVSVDLRNTQAESNLLLKDINEVLASRWLLRGRSIAATGAVTVFGSICGLTVDTTALAKGIVVLNYNGSLCDGRKREGQVILTVQDFPAMKLKSTGCMVRIDLNAYKITRATGSNLQFDGTAYLKNESGSTWYDLMFLNLPALIQSFTAENLQLTFNGSGALLYTISRRNTYTLAGNVLKCVVTGAGLYDGNNDVETIGATRDKNKFTGRVITPVVWTSACGPLYAVQGEVNISAANEAFELKCRYGTDQDGNAYDQSTCPYGWQISYSYKRKTKTRVFGYDN